VTKKQEFALLDKVINKLGPNSYIGPWLKDIRPKIVKCIENDMSIEWQMGSECYKSL